MLRLQRNDSHPLKKKNGIFAPHGKADKVFLGILEGSNSL